MTHRSDCTVKESARQRVDDLADRILETNTQQFVKDDQIVQEVEALGWEYLGSGLGRAAFRVPRSQQEGPGGNPTADADCVIKFAQTNTGRHNGIEQNREEVRNFRTLPVELTEEGDPPVFAPLKDWDDDHRWVSLPLADQRGGNSREAEDRLAEHGWHCNDLHMDNLGMMHGRTVILDYGLPCETIHPAIEEAAELARQLRDMGAVDVNTVEQDPSLAFVGWLPPSGLPGNEQARTESEATARSDPRTGQAGIGELDLTFGTWTSDQVTDDDLQRFVNRVIDETTDTWDVFHFDGGIADINDNREVWFEVEFGQFGPGTMPPEEAANLYADVIDLVGRFGPTDPGPLPTGQQTLSDVRADVVRSISNELTGRTNRTTGR